MTTKPRKEAVEAADEIMTHLSSDRHFGTYSRSRENLAEKIERRAIRPVADPLEKVLKLVRDECTYQTPAGTTNCRWCDNNMDHEGAYLDMHASDCIIHDVHAALAAYRGEGK